MLCWVVRRESLINCSFIFLGLTLGLFLAEAALRVFQIVQIPIGSPNTATKIEFPYNPSGSFDVRFNSDGNRGEELGEKSPNSRHVVIVGDSHTFGVGVDQEEVLDSKLETLLNEEELDKMTHVHNVARLGISLRKYLALLLAFKNYKPDLIVIVIYTGNDFVGLSFNPFTAVPIKGSEVFVPYSDKGIIERVKVRLRMFHSYHFLAQRNPFAEAIDNSEFDLARYGPWLQGIAQAEHYIKKPELYPEQVKGLSAALKYMKQQLSFAPHTIIAVVPSPMGVGGEEFDAYWLSRAAETNIPLAQLIAKDREIHSDIVKAASANFEHVVDLLGHFKKMSGPLYWPQDSHINDKAHQIIASVLSKKIIGQKLLE